MLIWGGGGGEFSPSGPSGVFPEEWKKQAGSRKDQTGDSGGHAGPGSWSEPCSAFRAREGQGASSVFSLQIRPKLLEGILPCV